MSRSTVKKFPVSALVCFQSPPPLSVLRQRGQVTYSYSCFFKIVSIITLRYTSRFLNSFHPLPFSKQDSVYMFISSLHAAFLNQYLPLPLMTRVRWKVLIRKLLIMPYPPSSCYSLPVITKYFPGQRVYRFNPYIFPRWTTFHTQLSIIFINHDHDHYHYYHHFSKELFRYSSVWFVFLCVCPVWCPFLSAF